MANTGIRQETLVVRGYKEFLKASAQAAPESRKAVREIFREVGDRVRLDAVRRMTPINSRSAAGYRTRVRQRGIAVEQSLKKTTGKRGDYGALQMRNVLLPALHDAEPDMRHDMERAMDRVCDHFEQKARP